MAEPPQIGIGLSPAFGRPAVPPTMSGLSAREVVVALVQGAVLAGCEVRLVRVNASVDVVRIAWEAARSVPSGIGIGVLAKGTAVLHSVARSPREIVELSPPAPLMDRAAYRSLATRAARLAKDLPVTVPDPVLVDPDLVAELVARVREYGATERQWCRSDPPVEDVVRLD
jgi:propanediol dehydratase large subunit